MTTTDPGAQGAMFTTPPAARPVNPGGIRVAVPVVIEMDGQQLAAYARRFGLAAQGERPPARDVVADVRRQVLDAARGAFHPTTADVGLGR